MFYKNVKLFSDCRVGQSEKRWRSASASVEIKGEVAGGDGHVLEVRLADSACQAERTEELGVRGEGCRMAVDVERAMVIEEGDVHRGEETGEVFGSRDLD